MIKLTMITPVRLGEKYPDISQKVQKLPVTKQKESDFKARKHGDGPSMCKRQ